MWEHPTKRLHSMALINRLSTLFIILVLITNMCILLSPLLFVIIEIWNWLSPRLLSSVLEIYYGAAEDGKTSYKTAKNVLELLNFISSPLLWVTAIIAFIVTYRQLREAKKARLAGIITAIEGRWSSAGIADSRKIIRQFIRDIQETGVNITDQEMPQLIDSKLQDEAKTAPDNYIKALQIVDFIEYIGVMEEKGYLDLDDLVPLIGEVGVYIYDMFKIHIEVLQRSSKANSAAHGLTNVPDTYAYFLRLNKKLQSRFR
jgi:hypothetical protein